MRQKIVDGGLAGLGCSHPMTLTFYFQQNFYLKTALEKIMTKTPWCIDISRQLENEKSLQTGWQQTMSQVKKMAGVK